MVFRGEHARRCDQASLGRSRSCGRYPHSSLQRPSTHSLGILSPKTSVSVRGSTINKGGLFMQAGLEVREL